MERPFVDWVRIEKFRCIQQVDLHLTPLHALIGPNDSGKSTILRAVQTAHATCWIHNTTWVTQRGRAQGSTYPAVITATGWINNPDVVAVAGANTLRLDPDEFRIPVPLIPKNKSLWFDNERGRGLAALYDALLSRNRNAFIAIDERFRQLFPTVASLRLENADTQTKTMGLTLMNKAEVGPNEMSEGMLYWLAFAIVEYIAPTGILLVEEPENGLHPARIKEVMRVLREVSKTTQVVMATHSPLVINELEAEEVTIVTRDAMRGTLCTPMINTKNFAERSKTYALGELWLSYADGDLEKDLVGPDTSAAKAG
jgi:predicted ATPase